MKKKGRIGPSFDDFLKEEGIHEEVTARAIKRVTAQQRPSLSQLMKSARGVIDSGVTDLASNPKHLEGVGRRIRDHRVGRTKPRKKRQ
jgi:hypothetical protein